MQVFYIYLFILYLNVIFKEFAKTYFTIIIIYL